MLDAYFADKTAKAGALVHMPTGTGKTAIMAILARARAGGKVVVVVSPSEALVEQLRIDFESVVWQRLGIGPPWSSLKVVKLLRRNAKEIAENLTSSTSKPVMLIGTIQALHDIRIKANDLYRAISSNTSLTIVDEGHREPALQWSASVENLGAPVVLFSATPYRNDVRFFNIDRNFIAYRSFGWAVEQGLIRDVVFEAIPREANAAVFVNEVVSHFKSLISNGRLASNAKAIIRFADFESLEAALTALEPSRDANSLGFVGVHDQYVGESTHRVHVIRDLRARQERLFLHQNKLTEGVDEPRCAALYLHQEFGNERQLVQQVGRIVRKAEPRNVQEPNALVVVQHGFQSKESWLRYRHFDEQYARGNAHIFDTEEYGRRVRELGLPAQYADRRFRSVPPATLQTPYHGDSVGEETLQFIRDVQLKRRCVAYNVDSDIELGTFAQMAQRLMEERGRNVIAAAIPYPEEYPNLHVTICHVVEHSDIFERYALMENHYTVTVLIKSAGRLYVYDNTGLSDPSKEPIKYADLSKLLPEHEDTAITMYAAKNTDLAPYAIRSRSVSGASLANSVPFLADFLNIVTRASGKLLSGGDRIGRYIGFQSGRITDSRAGRIDVKAFAEWCASIDVELSGSTTASAFFKRFAQRIEPPDNPIPLNILIDVPSLDAVFADSNKQEIQLDEFCSDIAANSDGKYGDYAYAFAVSSESAAGQRQTYQCYLKYDASIGRFRIRSDDLSKFTSDDPNAPISLADAIDREQAFRIILEQRAIAFAYGEFFDVSPSRPGMRQIVDSLILSDNRLTAIRSEKGKGPGKGSHWDADSLFNLIDRKNAQFKLPGFSGQWDAVICDDIGTELGDFIAYRLSPPAVVFINAKHKHKHSSISASALHEVLGQAIKNLDFIRIGGQGIPVGRASRWNGVWTSTENPQYVVRPRIRLGQGLGAEHVRRLNRLLGDAKTQRYVCALLSNALNKADLLASLSRNPSVVSTQAFLQLVSFYSAAASVSVTPVVICD